jgi:hypothetical protein
MASSPSSKPDHAKKKLASVVDGSDRAAERSDN